MAYAHVYMIFCTYAAFNEVFICNRVNISRAMGRHKNYCNNANHMMHSAYFYQVIRDNGGFDKWTDKTMKSTCVCIQRRGGRVEEALSRWVTRIVEPLHPYLVREGEILFQFSY